MRVSAKMAVLLTWGLVTGCASGSPAPSDEISESDVTALSARDLDDYSSLLSAIRTLRPTWIRRTREVFVDGSFHGPQQTLSSISPRSVLRVEMVPAPEARRRFRLCVDTHGTGPVVNQPRDPQCGQRPIIHVVMLR